MAVTRYDDVDLSSDSTRNDGIIVRVSSNNGSSCCWLNNGCKCGIAKHYLMSRCFSERKSLREFRTEQDIL